MPDERVRRVYEVAWLYHEKRWPQKKIAAHLGVDKATVSRSLKEAESRGTVKITLHPPGLAKLEMEFKDAFGLDRVLVAPSVPAPQRLSKGADDLAFDSAVEVQSTELGRAAAEFVGPAGAAARPWGRMSCPSFSADRGCSA